MFARCYLLQHPDNHPFKDASYCFRSDCKITVNASGFGILSRFQRILFRTCKTCRVFECLFNSDILFCCAMAGLCWLWYAPYYLVIFAVIVPLVLRRALPAYAISHASSHWAFWHKLTLYFFLWDPTRKFGISQEFWQRCERARCQSDIFAERGAAGHNRYIRLCL